MVTPPATTYGDFVSTPKKPYAPKKKFSKPESTISTGPAINIIEQFYNNQVVVLIVEGNAYNFRLFMLGNTPYNHKKKGILNPTMAFTFKSETYADNMNELTIGYVADVHPKLVGKFPQTLPSVFKQSNHGSGKINFVVGPKCIMTPGNIIIIFSY